MSSRRVQKSLKRGLYTILLAIGFSAFVATNSTYGVNILTTATPANAANALLQGASGITVTGTPTSIGTLQTFDSVNISTGRQFSGTGVFLDSIGGITSGTTHSQLSQIC
jgi:hypothetical protein